MIAVLATGLAFLALTSAQSIAQQTDTELPVEQDASTDTSNSPTLAADASTLFVTPVPSSTNSEPLFSFEPATTQEASFTFVPSSTEVGTFSFIPTTTTSEASFVFVPSTTDLSTMPSTTTAEIVPSSFAPTSATTGQASLTTAQQGTGLTSSATTSDSSRVLEGVQTSQSQTSQSQTSQSQTSQSQTSLVPAASTTPTPVVNASNEKQQVATAPAQPTVTASIQCGSGSQPVQQQHAGSEHASCATSVYHEPVQALPTTLLGQKVQVNNMTLATRPTGYKSGSAASEGTSAMRPILFDGAAVPAYGCSGMLLGMALVMIIGAW